MFPFSAPRAARPQAKDLGIAVLHTNDSGHRCTKLPRFARDFACGLKRPQSGSTSLALTSLTLGSGFSQDDISRTKQKPRSLRDRGFGLAELVCLTSGWHARSARAATLEPVAVAKAGAKSGAVHIEAVSLRRRCGRVNPVLYRQPLRHCVGEVDRLSR